VQNSQPVNKLSDRELGAVFKRWDPELEVEELAEAA
jgi:hypothetical protein